jgi:hypothetical protein
MVRCVGHWLLSGRRLISVFAGGMHCGAMQTIDDFKLDREGEASHVLWLARRRSGVDACLQPTSQRPGSQRLVQSCAAYT